MPVSCIYGLLVGSAMLLALASRNHVLQKLAMTLMLAWSSSNLSVQFLGFDKAPLLIPTFHGLGALVIALLGMRNRSNAALVVFIIYFLMGAIDVVCYIIRIQGTYTYYATLNALFLVQLATVGGTSGWVAVLRWSAARSQRIRHHGARSAYVEGGA